MTSLPQRVARFLRRTAARIVQSRVLVVAGSLALAAAPAARAQDLLFDYLGFDYEHPVVVPGVFGGIGNGYVSLGEVPVLLKAGERQSRDGVTVRVR